MKNKSLKLFVLFLLFALPSNAQVVDIESDSSKVYLNLQLRRTERRINEIEGWNINSLTGILAMDSGGTGVSLSGPGADRIGFWDDSAGAIAWLVPNTNLTISGTNLNATDTNTTIQSNFDATEINAVSSPPDDTWNDIKIDVETMAFYKNSTITTLYVEWEVKKTEFGTASSRVAVNSAAITGTSKSITISYAEKTDTIDISSLADNAFYTFVIQGYADSSPQGQSHYIKNLKWAVY